MRTVPPKFHCRVHCSCRDNRGLVVFEGVFNNARSNVPATTELIIPADILGDLPTGAGNGRGNYTAPPPEPATDNAGSSAGPSEPAAKPEEPVAPKAKVAPPETKDPNEIAIPKKTVPKRRRSRPIRLPRRRWRPTRQRIRLLINRPAARRRQLRTQSPLPNRLD